MKTVRFLSAAIFALALTVTTTVAQQKGSFTDTRDKKTYKTVKIGSQTWMAENLNYAAKDSKCYGEGELKEIGYDDNKYRTIYGGPKYTPAEIQAYCSKYGRLYSWETSKSICPAGWHLPSDEEWDVLYNAVGGKETAKNVLKSKSGWNDDTDFNSGKKILGNGEDKFGFAMLPGGGYGSCGDGEGNNYFSFVDSCGFFISSSIYNSAGYLHGAYYKVCSGGGSGFSDYASYKDCVWKLFSVRCLQDDANYVAKLEAMAAEAKAVVAAVKANSGTFKDSRDGKSYKTIKIGKQTWMAENLNYNEKDSKCYDKKPANCNKYGRLYDRDAAMEVCPAGWHLPSDEEWDELIRFTDGISGTESPYQSETAGKYLKAKSGWSNYGNGEDKFGFAALPGGGAKHYYERRDVNFNGIGYNGQWWSSTKNYFSPYRGMNYDSEDIYSTDTGFPYSNNLLSIRCLQD
ncbi:MAG: hypothetical protein FWF63_09520 [Fibromonadales bacterium]|nr:hypothetical protein [Fibromonadales bacterium]